MLNEILLKMVEVEQSIAISVNNIKKVKEGGDRKELISELNDAKIDLFIVESKIMRIKKAISREAKALKWLEKWLT